jgi:hypothetical protein
MPVRTVADRSLDDGLDLVAVAVGFGRRQLAPTESCSLARSARAATLTDCDWPVADASPARLMHACAAMTDYGHELEHAEA